MVLGVYLDWVFRHEIVTSHALSGLICESDKCWIPKQDFAACELIELDVICPGLGPSGVWLAHGKVWLLRYERRWQARFTTLQHQPLILSCVPRLALPLQEEQHLHGNTHLANTCVCTFFPRPLAARRLVSEGKVFDSFCLEMTACRISLDSWWWSNFFFFFFSPTPRLFPLHLRELLWPAHPPCPLCQVSGRAAFVTRWFAFSTPPPHHHHPGFTPPSPGIMRTWRRRRNFAFLIFALRVWCLSTAAESADSTVHNTQEGEQATHSYC